MQVRLTVDSAVLSARRGDGRASSPSGSPTYLWPALVYFLSRMELTLSLPGRPRRAQVPPAPSSRLAKLGPVGRQPLAYAGPS